MTERQSIQNLPTYGTIYDEEEALYAGELPEVYYSPVSNEDHNFPPVLMDMYEKYMESHPVLTTVVQTFLLVLFSDICAQVIRAVLTKEASSFDWVRLYAVGTWSIIFMGPSIYYWHEFLDWWVTGNHSTLYKMLIDQMVFAPFFCGMFIFGVGFLEHPNDIMRAVSSVSEKIIPTMTVNYFIWPAVLLINFSFVPKTWRLLFLNSVGFFWIILLTYITHRTNGKTPHMEPVESITNRAYAFIKIWLEMY